MLKRKSFVLARIAFFAVLTLAVTEPLFAQHSFYAEQDGTLSISSQSFVPIAGLVFELPAETAHHKCAIITLNLPNLYLSGTPQSGFSLGGAGQFSSLTSPISRLVPVKMED